MANDEHLAKLRIGWMNWTVWRKDNPGVIPDLSEAILPGIDLVGFNLASANLRLANLSGANCTFTDLGGADLSRANLRGTRFDHTYLDSADLSHATFGGTTLANVSLDDVRGLDTIQHAAPSSIGIDTFFRSGGLPESFLRGCGVPDTFIAYAASLVGKPIEYYSCFLSYSTKDTQFAKRLYADLQARGIRTWFAPEDLKIGDPLKSTIDQSIRLHDKLLLVVSENSIGSAWVEREVEAAMRQEQRQQRTVLFPVRLDDSIFGLDDGWATDLRQRHIGDFREWKSHDSYARAFDRLVRDLKKLA